MIVGYYITDNIGKAITNDFTTVYKTWDEALNEATKQIDNLIKQYGKDATIISLINSKSKESCDNYGYSSVYKILLKGVCDNNILYIVPKKKSTKFADICKISL